MSPVGEPMDARAYQELRTDEVGVLPLYFDYDTGCWSVRESDWRRIVTEWLEERIPTPGHLSWCGPCPACGHEVNFARRMDEYEPGLGYSRVWFVRECVACGAGWTYDQ